MQLAPSRNWHPIREAYCYFGRFRPERHATQKPHGQIAEQLVVQVVQVAQAALVVQVVQAALIAPLPSAE